MTAISRLEPCAYASGGVYECPPYTAVYNARARGIRQRERAPFISCLSAHLFIVMSRYDDVAFSRSLTRPHDVGNVIALMTASTARATTRSWHRPSLHFLAACSASTRIISPEYEDAIATKMILRRGPSSWLENTFLYLMTQQPPQDAIRARAARRKSARTEQAEHEPQPPQKAPHYHFPS